MKKRIRSFLFFVSFIVTISSIGYTILESLSPDLAASIEQYFPQPTPVLTPIVVSLTPAVLGDQQQVGEVAKVKKVVDGDTIELENGQRVRYIGIDTPESKKPNTPVQCFAEAAALKNKELVEGKEVTLIKDISNTDRYDRLLRYVFVEDKFVNEVLVKEGFAFARSYPPDIARQPLLRASEQLAREQKLGLWGSCHVRSKGTKGEYIIQ